MNGLRYFKRVLAEGVDAWTKHWIWALCGIAFATIGTVSLVQSRFWSRQYIWVGLFVLAIVVLWVAVGGAYRIEKAGAEHQNRLSEENASLRDQLAARPELGQQMPSSGFSFMHNGSVVAHNNEGAHLTFGHNESVDAQGNIAH